MRVEPAGSAEGPEALTAGLGKLETALLGKAGQTDASQHHEMWKPSPFTGGDVVGNACRNQDRGQLKQECSGGKAPELITRQSRRSDGRPTRNQAGSLGLAHSGV